MIHQLTFADGEFNGKRRQIRKEILLSRLEQWLPGQVLAVIEPIYPSEAPLLLPRFGASAVQRRVPATGCRQLPAASAQKLARRCKTCCTALLAAITPP